MNGFVAVQAVMFSLDHYLKYPGHKMLSTPLSPEAVESRWVREVVCVGCSGIRCSSVNVYAKRQSRSKGLIPIMIML